jgi:hypothetical protein
MTADHPQPLLDGAPRCEHDMRPEWCAICRGDADVDLFEPDRTVNVRD